MRRFLDSDDLAEIDAGITVGYRYGLGKSTSAPAGEFSCGLDADMEGVPNHRDECPETSRQALVDEPGRQVVLEGDGASMAPESEDR